MQYAPTRGHAIHGFRITSPAPTSKACFWSQRVLFLGGRFCGRRTVIRHTTQPRDRRHQPREQGKEGDHADTSEHNKLCTLFECVALRLWTRHQRLLMMPSVGRFVRVVRSHPPERFNFSTPNRPLIRPKKPQTMRYSKERKGLHHANRPRRPFFCGAQHRATHTRDQDTPSPSVALACSTCRIVRPFCCVACWACLVGLP